MSMQGRGIREVSKFYLVMAVLFWLMTALCVVLIFSFSSDDGYTSSNLSRSIVLWIREHIFGFEVTELMVRKLAHVTEFSILALLTFLSFYCTNKISVETSYAESTMKILKSDNEMNIGMSLWFCILVAIFDEYHQLFVYQRSGSIIDVGIDCIGIVTILLIIRIIFTIYLRRIGKEEIRYD